MRSRTVICFALALLCAACHCPTEIELVRPAEVCFTPDIASEVGLSHRGCVGNPVVFAAENAVWWPYKIVATPLSGGFQGVMGAYSVAGDPVTGTLLAPFGLVVGVTLGAFNGFFQQPDVIESHDDLAEAFSYPWITDQEIWKTSTPPSGTFYGWRDLEREQTRPRAEIDPAKYPFPRK